MELMLKRRADGAFTGVQCVQCVGYRVRVKCISFALARRWMVDCGSVSLPSCHMAPYLKIWVGFAIFNASGNIAERF